MVLGILLVLFGIFIRKRQKNFTAKKKSLILQNFTTTWDQVIVNKLVSINGGAFGPTCDLWKGQYKGATVSVQRTFGMKDYKFDYKNVDFLQSLKHADNFVECHGAGKFCPLPPGTLEFNAKIIDSPTFVVIC